VKRAKPGASRRVNEIKNKSNELIWDKTSEGMLEVFQIFVWELL